MKYLTVVDNKILGWNEDASFEGCVETDSNIPEFDPSTQSLYWEKSTITVKDDADKIARNKERSDNLYKEKRRRQFPEIGDQLDLLFHDMTADKGDKTGEWYNAIAKVKSDNPKP